MKPRMLPIYIPIMDLGTEIMHTHSLLNAYSFLAAQAAEFETFYQEWLQLLQQELALARGRDAAEARAVVIDDRLDFLCGAIASTILAGNGQNRKAPEYLRYYGDMPPSKLKRPILGRQLKTMQKWPPSLTQPENSQALREYGQELDQLVPVAEDAMKAIGEAEREIADWEIGGRKKFVDKLNAARLVLYGQLAEIPIRRPELMLDRQFATRFFLRNHRDNSELSIPEIERRLFRITAQKQHYEEMLQRRIEERDAAAQAEEDAELAAAEAALAEIEAERQEVAARIAELQAVRKRKKPQ